MGYTARQLRLWHAEAARAERAAQADLIEAIALAMGSDKLPAVLRALRSASPLAPSEGG
jgi:hypothetical protein